LRHTAAFALVLAILAWGTGSANADLITNGSFSTPNVGTGWSTFSGTGSAASDGVNGWTDTLGQIEIDNTAVVGLQPYNGFSHSLEVNSTAPDTIRQTVSGLTAGTQYDLTFGYGVRPGSGAQELKVFFGSTLLATYNAANSATGFWTSENYLVTATATSGVLEFEGVYAGGQPSYGNEIADVSLSQAAVPASEPASIAVLGAAILVIGLLHRRRATARI
jgi:hypothetical protein